MNTNDILEIIELTPRYDFPLLPCQELFFENTNHSRIQNISYKDLINEIKNSKNGRFVQDDPYTIPEIELDNRCGIDILAYYVPFHYGQGQPWGIYIKDIGVELIAHSLLTESEILAQYIPLEVKDAECLAVNKLLLHELGHHAVEVAITFLAKQSSSFPSYYDYTVSKKYHKKEEALCNWNVKAQKKNFVIPVDRAKIDYYNYIESFMLKQPSGYRDFLDWPKKKFFDNLSASKKMEDAVKEFTKHSRLTMVKRNTVPIYLIETTT